MFASLKEKFLSSAWAPQDEHDKAISELLERATSERLTSPDWDSNMRLVDMVNRSPQLMEEKLMRGLRRCFIKGGARSQLMTMIVLETCIKNCHASIYGVLSASELWSDMVKAAMDTSVHRVDGEVRDKILTMVEDYATVLPQPMYKETYEKMVISGVDFPVRADTDVTPILTPPPTYHPHQDPHAGVGAAAGAAAGMGATGATINDPFAGMSDEDKAAVQAAMMEMSQEATAASNQAAGGGAVTGMPLTNSQAALYAAPAATVARAQSDAADAVLADGETTEAKLQVMANSTAFLQEMVASLPADDPSAIRQPYITELGEQCVRLQSTLISPYPNWDISKLEVMISGLTDEKEMMDALAQHEHMLSVLAKYNEALANAQGAAPGASPAGLAPGATLAGATGGAEGPDGAARDHGGAGPNFTLIDDDEAVDEAPILVSNRQPSPNLQTNTANNNSQDPAVPTSAPAAPTPLIDLLDEQAPVPPPVPAPVQPTEAATEGTPAAPFPPAGTEAAAPSAPTPAPPADSQGLI